MKTIRGRFRAAVLMGAAASVLAFAVGAKAQDHNDKDDPHPTTIRGRTQRRVNRPCWRWLATSPASQARRGAGEAANEVCTDPATPPTPAPLCGNPRRPLRIRLRL